jgi:hypothetical protein
VQCQAQGCGHSVYKRIHVVLIGLEFKVLGSQCYQRLYGSALSAAVTPQYGSLNGRRLTAEERRVLVDNTARFIEALEAERLALERIADLEAARRQQEKTERVATRPPLHAHQTARPLLQLEHVPEDARSPSYEGSEMLRWQWRDATARASSVARYRANPSPGLHHAAVMNCFETKPGATPYQFALDVELKHRLPKRYIFRALDELGLIEESK